MNNPLYAELTRLRRDNKVMSALNETFPLEIIRLEEEIDRLRAALKTIADDPDYEDCDIGYDGKACDCRACQFVRIAREATRKREEGEG